MQKPWGGGSKKKRVARKETVNSNHILSIIPPQKSQFSCFLHHGAMNLNTAFQMKELY
jgi:hypothetical protein